MNKYLISFFIFFALVSAVFFSSCNPGFYSASFSDAIIGWVTINPLTVKISAPAEEDLNKTFLVKGAIINRGEEKIENVKVKIHLPGGLILVGRDSVQEIKTVAPKKEKTVFWLVKGEKPGTYIIIVSANGQLKGDLISAEVSAVVKIKEKTFPLRKPFFNFFQQKFLNFWEWFKREI